MDGGRCIRRWKDSVVALRMTSILMFLLCCPSGRFVRKISSVKGWTRKIESRKKNTIIGKTLMVDMETPSGKGSRKRVVFLDGRRESQSEKERRKCSYCREYGHNSRTCGVVSPVSSIPIRSTRAVRWKRTFSQHGPGSVCKRCNNAGFVSCIFCNQDESLEGVECSKNLSQTVERQIRKEKDMRLTDLGKLSRMKYQLHGKTKTEVCVKCSGTTFMVCPSCRGEPF
eukprot:jgi/Galph1/5483/GphlegSOOS_G4139.1